METNETLTESTVSEENGQSEAIQESGGQESWSLNGFAPTEFVYTPWEQIFPEVTIRKSVTQEDINFSKIVIYQMTRVQYSQFLEFAYMVNSDVQDATRPTRTDFYEYKECLVDYSNSLLDFINGDFSLDNDEYYNRVLDFTSLLMEKKLFQGIYNYLIFFDYYEYMIQCPYGMILHDYKTRLDIDGTVIYESDENRVLTEIIQEADGTQTPVFKTILCPYKRFEEGLRIYPIPSYDPYRAVLFELCYFQRGVVQEGEDNEVDPKDLPQFVKLKELKIDDKISYNTRITELDLIKSKERFPNKFVFDTKHSLEPTHLGFEDLDSEGLFIDGANPMFEDFPFDEVAGYSSED